LIFLLKFGITENMINPTEMVEKTLISMYKGGLYDHLAGGFLRYSTDEKWLIPFFEKTLSTNALLVISYLDIFQITKSPLYKIIIENTLKYVNEEMINDNYSFCFSENLGISNKDEDFYTFDYSEIINLLGDEDGSYFNDYYGITKEGNFNNKNILNLIDNYNFNKINTDINRLKEEVCSFRKKRKSLLKDFRIITYVNSLMSIAYTKAYRILNNGDYLELAIKNNKFIKDNLIDNKNNLLRSTTKDTVKNWGYLDDYAYFIWSLIDLYESTFDVNYLEDAINYTKDMINLFWDFDYNGFFFSSKYYDPLILNLKYIEDNELPSGNSVAAFVLVKLNHLTKDDYLSDFCKKQFKVFYAEVSEAPVNYTFYLSALIQNLYHSTDIICISQDNEIPNDLRLLISDRFIPNLNILLITPNNKEKLLSLAPYTKDYKILNNKTTYYLFKNNKLIECSNILNI
ncbi:thioredoxin domain-containing protein, partial [Clostridium sp.]|uniref:thioredoxin domain-containing protein n=1 Tax=Clostridium sp. TaxID=1506 RepID=UPI003F396882